MPVNEARTNTAVLSNIDRLTEEDKREGNGSMTNIHPTPAHEARYADLASTWAYCKTISMGTCWFDGWCAILCSIIIYPSPSARDSIPKEIIGLQ